MKKTNTKKGFTIIELVIVIAVIGILAAVLIPTFSGVIEKANESAAMQAARNEYELFLAEHAAEMDGTENYTIVTNGYKFSVKAGQFDATATKLADNETFAGRDLTKVVKTVKTGDASGSTVAAPTNPTDIVTGGKIYKDSACTTVIEADWEANTTYYYVSTEDIGNAEVAIYKAA